jgi:deoxyribodipyrimidine photo-lyase
MGRGPAVAWFRRDLRLADNPMLAAAAGDADGVVGLFVADPALLTPAGRPRLGFLEGAVAELVERTEGALVVRHGDPAAVVAEVAVETGATAVHVADDFGPYGRRRDASVAAALAERGIDLVRTGSPYAVAPGTLHASGGGPFKVFTPYHRAWTAAGWEAPTGEVDGLRWIDGLASQPLALGGVTADRFPAGEAAAHQRLDRFLAEVDRYHERRDRADLDGTSELSPYLRFGCLHPRQVLDRLGDRRGEAAFRRQLCWRDFYADVLVHHPDSARVPLQARLAGLRVDEGATADERLRAWLDGRTGYPLVDAGMRQLAADGWMPNRVRMVVASFLVKDLHLPWWRGAREFMRRLVDGDLASNSHGWQWTAGTGTDPAPFHRVFNPTLQARRADPDGDYIRRWVPELSALAAPEVHEPWSITGGPPGGYPTPIVDHAAERADALARLAALRG